MSMEGRGRSVVISREPDMAVLTDFYPASQPPIAKQEANTRNTFIGLRQLLACCDSLLDFPASVLSL